MSDPGSSSPRSTDRLRGLAPPARERMERATQHVARGEHARAIALLHEAAATNPAHPELLHLRGVIEQREGRFASAVALLQQAASLRTDDGMILGNLGAALAATGDLDAAIAAFRRATELDPSLIDAWFNLGRALELRGDAAGSHAAFGAVLELAPRHQPARILRAESLKTLGRLEDSETELRAVLREDPRAVSAWVALINLKSFRADTNDLDALARLYADPALPEALRIDLGFAYASVLEAAQQYEQAFAVFASATAAKRRTLHWDAAAVAAMVDEILAQFADPSPATDDAERGRGVVFLVGMPRSGSTLTEQILAAHPDVSAGGETGFVADVLQAESRRRSSRFPLWIRDADAADWHRLGDDYLARIMPMRGDAAVFTDKTLTNWQALGAIRRMLPAARIVHCRRDPLETAWSCFKHNFAKDQLYSYDFAELAAFFRDESRAMEVWHARYPGWIHDHSLEALTDDPESVVRALLAHCGLAFDPACLRFHEVEREVRTASAAQVRRPLRKAGSIAHGYGQLLDPLHKLLDADSRWD